ncbi:hypothetical protein M885DRAFT_623332 [Pelagophyceae sp. CCMP2097]|nr:hypothetical protein M885DRAFT_623332 [Pelagophyceae sp. CCMP2097]
MAQPLYDFEYADDAAQDRVVELSRALAAERARGAAQERRHEAQSTAALALLQKRDADVARLGAAARAAAAAAQQQHRAADASLRAAEAARRDEHSAAEVAQLRATVAAQQLRLDAPPEDRLAAPPDVHCTAPEDRRASPPEERLAAPPEDRRGADGPRPRRAPDTLRGAVVAAPPPSPPARPADNDAHELRLALGEALRADGEETKRQGDAARARAAAEVSSARRSVDVAYGEVAALRGAAHGMRTRIGALGDRLKKSADAYAAADAELQALRLSHARFVDELRAAHSSALTAQRATFDAELQAERAAVDRDCAARERAHEAALHDAAADRSAAAAAAVDKGREALAAARAAHDRAAAARNLDHERSNNAMRLDLQSRAPRRPRRSGATYKARQRCSATVGTAELEQLRQRASEDARTPARATRAQRGAGPSAPSKLDSAPEDRRADGSSSSSSPLTTASPLTIDASLDRRTPVDDDEAGSRHCAGDEDPSPAAAREPQRHAAVDRGLAARRGAAPAGAPAASPGRQQGRPDAAGRKVTELEDIKQRLAARAEAHAMPRIPDDDRSAALAAARRDAELSAAAAARAGADLERAHGDLAEAQAAGAAAARDAGALRAAQETLRRDAAAARSDADAARADAAARAERLADAEADLAAARADLAAARAGLARVAADLDVSRGGRGHGGGGLFDGGLVVVGGASEPPVWPAAVPRDALAAHAELLDSDRRLRAQREALRVSQDALCDSQDALRVSEDALRAARAATAHAEARGDVARRGGAADRAAEAPARAALAALVAAHAAVVAELRGDLRAALEANAALAAAPRLEAEPGALRLKGATSHVAARGAIASPGDADAGRQLRAAHAAADRLTAELEVSRGARRATDDALARALHQVAEARAQAARVAPQTAAVPPTAALDGGGSLVSQLESQLQRDVASATRRAAVLEAELEQTRAQLLQRPSACRDSAFDHVRARGAPEGDGDEAALFDSAERELAALDARDAALHAELDRRRSREAALERDLAKMAARDATLQAELLRPGERGGARLKDTAAAVAPGGSSVRHLAVSVLHRLTTAFSLADEAPRGADVSAIAAGADALLDALDDGAARRERSDVVERAPAPEDWRLTTELVAARDALARARDELGRADALALARAADAAADARRASDERAAEAAARFTAQGAEMRGRSDAALARAAADAAACRDDAAACRGEVASMRRAASDAAAREAKAAHAVRQLEACVERLGGELRKAEDGRAAVAERHRHDFARAAGETKAAAAEAKRRAATGAAHKVAEAEWRAKCGAAELRAAEAQDRAKRLAARAHALQQTQAALAAAPTDATASRDAADEAGADAGAEGRRQDRASHERFVALRRRVSDAEARGAAADALRADAERQRRAARASAARKEVSVRLLRARLDRAEADAEACRAAAVEWRRDAHARLETMRSAAKSDGNTLGLEREHALMVEARLGRVSAVLRQLAREFAQGLERAALRRQHAADGPARGAASSMSGLVAASMLDMSPPEIALLLATLDDDDDDDGSRRRVSAPSPSPLEAEVAAALGAVPVDERALVEAFRALVEARLDHERSLAFALAKRAAAQTSASSDRLVATSFDAVLNRE